MRFWLSAVYKEDITKKRELPGGAASRFFLETEWFSSALLFLEVLGFL